MEWEGEFEPDLFGNAKPTLLSGFSQHRSYFGLVPPPRVAQELERDARTWAREARATRATPASQFHVSLNGISEGEPMAPELLEDALEIGAAIRRARFEIIFDVLQTWDKNKRRNFPTVLCCSSSSRGALELYEVLRREMRRYGIKSPSSFNPHITLFYSDGRVRTRSVARPVRLWVDAFWLIHSVVGTGRLEHLARWPLGF
ncbi:2'-5' RNA ligase family protein [Devosia sp.]|uniref:2'-5' RNA ligase family protein n=1 Tax=Devosia sp. TaxID=1871048 RepID=UPI00345B9C85